MIDSSAHTVRLLLVDGSPGIRERLRRLFESVPGIDVVGDTGAGDKALRLLGEASPSAVLMDCGLSGRGSFAVVEDMMRLYRVPIVMMTKQREVAGSELEARALRTGAVALVHWDPQEPGADREPFARLARVVKAMSEVKVVRRRDPSSRREIPDLRTAPASAQPAAGGRIEIVAIGASTGGPPVILTILRGLSQPLPVPILVVQHLSRGFQDSLVRWLADSAGVPVWTGQHGVRLAPGGVYLAPDDRHMAVDAAGRLLLTDDPPENASRPSVSVLFRSVAQAYGPRSIGILLTGMGRDGAKELRLMRDTGAITIAQDEGTSVVHGMPGEAIKLKGARYVLAPDHIAAVVQHHLAGSLRTPLGAGAVPSIAG